jgi:hypothetical protein
MRHPAPRRLRSAAERPDCPNHNGRGIAHGRLLNGRDALPSGGGYEGVDRPRRGSFVGNRKSEIQI